MRVAVVLDGIPQPGASGGAMAMWSLIEALQRRGHGVCCLSFCESTEAADTHLAALAALDARGVEATVMTVPRPDPPRSFLQALLQQSARSAPQRYFGTEALTPGVASWLASAAPDVVLAFDVSAMIPVAAARTCPALAIPGDPRDAVWRYQLKMVRGRARRSKQYVSGLIAYLLVGTRLNRFVVNLARGFDSVAMFGAQHAREMQDAGVACLYLPIPVSDRSGATILASLSAPPHDPREILVLGGLQSTASLLGFEVLRDEILPELSRALAAEELEVVIAGSGELSGEFRSSFTRAGVRLAGFVEDSAEVMRACDVFLVPSPYPVGARTRLVEALSSGAAIVAHTMCAIGIPELRNRENALLASNGHGLAAAVSELVRDDTLRMELRRAARETYEEHFRPDIACAGIVDQLERLAPAR